MGHSPTGKPRSAELEADSPPTCRSLFDSSLMLEAAVVVLPP